MRLVVVGAGIVGSACAYAASSLGAEVTLIDAGWPGQATAAGAGIICPWTSGVDDPGGYDFACAAARAYPALVAELADLGEADVSYRQSGAIVVADREDELEPVRAGLRGPAGRAPRDGGRPGRHRLRGPAPVPAVAPAHARGVHPGCGAGGRAEVQGRPGQGGVPERGHDPGGRRGAGVPGRAGRRRAGRGELIEADAVVAATGAWTTSFVEPAGAVVRVTPQRGQIVHLSLGSTDTRHWPVVLPVASGHYLLAFEGSRVVVGATREPGAGFDHRVTAAGLSQVLAEALTVAPGLGSATYLETRVGFRPAGPGGCPLLGPVPGMAGLFVATGLGAEGLTMGPYAGGVAARAALGLDPGLDLAPFDPLRQ